MKQKTNKATVKRIKVKKSGVMMVQKAAKNHRLTSKSKRQKGAFPNGMPIHKTKAKAIRKLLPGMGKLSKMIEQY